MLERKKRGFAVNVVDSWFKSAAGGELAGMLMDEGSLMFELLEPQRVRTLLEDHQSGQHDNHKLLFSLVMLEQWLRGSSKEYRIPSAGTINPQYAVHHQPR